jgi:hypothetical protein
VSGGVRAAIVGVPEGEAGARGASAGDRSRIDRRLGAALVLLVLLIFSARVAFRYRPLTYLVGDCPYYAATTVSILQDRDLDLRNQLQGGLEVHGRQIALGRDGAWYPKHPLLMPIAALPFVLALGVPGTLVFNLAVLALLALAMMRLARTVAPPRAATAAALLLILGTFLREYDYNFSPDLFATLILAAGLVDLVRGRDARGGLLLGLAVAAKLTDLFLLPFGIAYVAWCRGARGALRAAAAAAAPLLALAIVDLQLFGSPLVTAYDRNVAVEGGSIVTLSHRGLFDVGVGTGLRGELLDPVHGLLPTAPALLLALPGFVAFFRRRPREALLALALSEFLILLFATYRYWASSHYGNRFLMPVVALSAPAVALSLQWMAERAALAVVRHRNAASARAPT